MKGSQDEILTSDEESVAHIENKLGLNPNPQAHVKNPLAGISRPQLLRNVEEFVLCSVGAATQSATFLYEP
jgi:hypothetical protein